MKRRNKIAKNKNPVSEVVNYPNKSVYSFGGTTNIYGSLDRLGLKTPQHRTGSLT
jgi:hypothetical protein